MIQKPNEWTVNQDAEKDFVKLYQEVDDDCEVL